MNPEHKSWLEHEHDRLCWESGSTWEQTSEAAHREWLATSYMNDALVASVPTLYHVYEIGGETYLMHFSSEERANRFYDRVRLLGLLPDNFPPASYSEPYRQEFYSEADIGCVCDDAYRCNCR